MIFPEILQENPILFSGGGLRNTEQLLGALVFWVRIVHLSPGPMYTRGIQLLAFTYMQISGLALDLNSVLTRHLTQFIGTLLSLLAQCLQTVCCLQCQQSMCCENRILSSHFRINPCLQDKHCHGAHTGPTGQARSSGCSV